MKVLYIAGPYRGKTESDVVRNIRAAEAAAIDAWRKGWAVICPHKNTALFGGLCDDVVWLEGDMELLRRSDAVLAIDGWLQSTGAQAEILKARELGIPVYYGHVCQAEEAPCLRKD